MFTTVVQPIEIMSSASSRSVEPFDAVVRPSMTRYTTVPSLFMPIAVRGFVAVMELSQPSSSNTRPSFAMMLPLPETQSCCASVASEHSVESVTRSPTENFASAASCPAASEAVRMT